MYQINRKKYHEKGMNDLINVYFNLKIVIFYLNSLNK